MVLHGKSIKGSKIQFLVYTINDHTTCWFNAFQQDMKHTRSRERPLQPTVAGMPVAGNIFMSLQGWETVCV